MGEGSKLTLLSLTRGLNLTIAFIPSRIIGMHPVRTGRVAISIVEKSKAAL